MAEQTIIIITAVIVTAIVMFFIIRGDKK